MSATTIGMSIEIMIDDVNMTDRLPDAGQAGHTSALSPAGDGYYFYWFWFSGSARRRA